MFDLEIERMGLGSGLGLGLVGAWVGDLVILEIF